jgi:peptidoglycan/xylan/chitin deacetylase (PgdA/CDA1 family)
MRSRVLLGLALATAFARSGPARAEGWPSPAAGLTMTGDPEVVLTFDDGPNPATTGLVLDTLKAHHIQAIFFLVGWRFQHGELEKSRALVARMLADGHVVANHTITHAQLCGLAPELIDREIAGAREILEREVSMRVPWFRVPYGAYCHHLVEALTRNGVDHFHWDLDPQEWQGKSAKATAAYVIRHLAKLQGRAVLLMHDTKSATARALPEILTWLDSENARRAAVGRRQIRVISGPELAAERLRPTLLWLRKAVAATRTRVDATLAATVP